MPRSSIVSTGISGSQTVAAISQTWAAAVPVGRAAVFVDIAATSGQLLIEGSPCGAGMFPGQHLHLGEDEAQVLGVPSRTATAARSRNLVHLKLGLGQDLRDPGVELGPQRRRTHGDAFETFDQLVVRSEEHTSELQSLRHLV